MRRKRRSNNLSWHLRRRRSSSAGCNCCAIRGSPKRKARIWVGIADLLAVLTTLLFFGLIYLLAAPFKQGFFCDDRTIFKPYMPNTVEMWHLALYGGVGPLFLFLFVELWITRPYGKDDERKKRRRAYGGSIFHTWFLFLLGIAATFLLTEVGKRSFGRLRPHFIQICQPDWSQIQCYNMVKSANNLPVRLRNYVTEFTCLGNDTASINEARISFPSGHSAIACFSFIFITIYLEARFTCSYIRFLKPIIQCACICIALFTCLSRITDNMHHPTDVLGGAIIGSSVALLIITRVGNILWTYGIYTKHSNPWFVLRRPTHDFARTSYTECPTEEIDCDAVPKVKVDIPTVPLPKQRPQSLHSNNGEGSSSAYDFSNHSSSYEQTAKPKQAQYKV